MASYFENGFLVTKSPGKITLTLTCGYGQPVTTSVFLIKQDGGSEKIKAFDGNTNNLEIGDSSVLKSQRLKIHSTIHDIQDNAPGQETEDINLYEKISCNEEFADVKFVEKTTGKGEFINCFYEVTII